LNYASPPSDLLKDNFGMILRRIREEAESEKKRHPQARKKAYKRKKGELLVIECLSAKC